MKLRGACPQHVTWPTFGLANPMERSQLGLFLTAGGPWTVAEKSLSAIKFIPNHKLQFENTLPQLRTSLFYNKSTVYALSTTKVMHHEPKTEWRLHEFVTWALHSCSQPIWWSAWWAEDSVWILWQKIIRTQPARNRIHEIQQSNFNHFTDSTLRIHWSISGE